MPFGLTLESLLDSVISGIVTSLIIFAVLPLFRPRIRVSRNIVQRWSKIYNCVVYEFKIRNRSVLKLLDMNVEAMLITSRYAAGNVNLTVQELKFTRSRVTKLSGWSPFDKEAKYACRMAINEDLATIWEDDSQHIEVLISARHPWSGLTRWFIRRYYLKDGVVVQGEFESGRPMGYKPKPNNHKIPRPKD